MRSIPALHEDLRNRDTFFMSSAALATTLNDKDGKQYGEVTYKPDQILCSTCIRGTAGSTATSRSNSSAPTCRKRK